MCCHAFHCRAVNDSRCSPAACVGHSCRRQSCWGSASDLTAWSGTPVDTSATQSNTRLQAALQFSTNGQLVLQAHSSSPRPWTNDMHLRKQTNPQKGLADQSNPAQEAAAAAADVPEQLYKVSAPPPSSSAHTLSSMRCRVRESMASLIRASGPNRPPPAGGLFLADSASLRAVFICWLLGSMCRPGHDCSSSRD